MLDSSILHHSRSGPGADGDVVGISWKAPTRSHPSPSLVVTCAHQVIVYKAGEARRTHQWSFKPSAATVLSHPAVFLPTTARYVGVQQGSTLVSWRESEQSVKLPLSVQAEGVVQAVHPCPTLGDYFVAVLSTGEVGLYRGGLDSVAQSNGASAGGGIGARATAGRPQGKVVWSGTRGDMVLLLERVGNAERLTVFQISVPSPSRSQDSNSPAASVTVVSSQGLPKPSKTASGMNDVGTVDKVEPSACSAAFLGGLGPKGCCVVSVAWSTPSGPMWTKVTLSASGLREDLTRPAATTTAAVDSQPLSCPAAAADVSSSNGDKHGEVAPSLAHSNGHKKRRKSESANADESRQMVDTSVSGRAGASRGSIPALAAGDRGRLVVHSGGPSPRLALWDAAYGVLMDSDEAPEVRAGGHESIRLGRAVTISVSGDGAYLALAAAGKVFACPLPAADAGSLASLLQRKNAARAPGTHLSGAPEESISVNLSRCSPVLSLLRHTGSLDAEKWDEEIVKPSRDAEVNVLRSLRTAAHHRDREAFELIMQEHIQQTTAMPQLKGGADARPGKDGRKRKRRHPSTYHHRIISEGVRLCLADPGGEIWKALGIFIRDGGVSAREHRGLVQSVIDHGTPRLLEEVMLHVPDLPEADAVRILRHCLSEAATLAMSAEPAPSAGLLAESSAKAETAKRARSSKALHPPCNTGEVPDPEKGDERVRASNVKRSSKKRKATVAQEGKDEVDPPVEARGGNGVAADALSNGHASNPAQHASGDDDASADVDDERGSEQSLVKQAHMTTTMGRLWERRSRGAAEKARESAALAERGIRMALSLPHNEAFLRSALAGLSHGEVVVILKVLNRVLAEGRTRENAGMMKPGGIHSRLCRGLPPVRTDALLAWTSAVLDAHFTRLAVGGVSDAALVGALKALQQTTKRETECCELLCQVRSLTDEVARRHAVEAAGEARRRSKRELFSLRVLRF